METQNRKPNNTDSSSASSKLTTKKSLLNYCLRKYAKPKVFKDTFSQDTIYKNLAASFKHRPALKISQYTMTLPKSIQCQIKSPVRSPQLNDSSEIPSIISLNVVRHNSPTKIRPSKKEKLKPMFKRYAKDQGKMTIEGRPCSRSSRTGYFDIKTNENTHKRAQSHDIRVHVELRKNVNQSYL
ncbi:hypothetical protein SteCoe_28529 [Stentor coeruleus]|uniref:Uncharacterized protein n=1 Tax=Stentor coeruleus TaxID=5963 RepID=A0A1R2B824_9CILI|nr:hypothetical protein SteCoe_28529 [Stentor coeruleus]